MIIHRKATVGGTIKQVKLIHRQQGQDRVQTQRRGCTSLLQAIACLSYMVTFSNKAHRQPELTAVQGGGLENLLKSDRHMTTRKASYKCRSGTKEVGMLTVKQTVMLIIHLLHMTALT
jgi:hypothetical protein